MREFIQDYKNGTFTINNKEINYSVKLFNTSISKITVPSTILLGHVAALISRKPSYLIIGTGPFGSTKMPEELEDYIERQHIRLIIKPTPQACKEYNRLLADGKIVAGLLVHAHEW